MNFCVDTDSHFFFKILLYKLYVILQDDFPSDSCKSVTILRVLLSEYNSLWKYYLITEILNILILEKYLINKYVSENIQKCSRIIIFYN